MPKKGEGSSDLDPNEGFNRFTPRARNVVVASHNEAQAARHAEIVPAHLILGLLAEPEAVAARVLVGQGVSRTCCGRRRPRRCPPRWTRRPS